MGEGLVVHQAAHGLDGTDDLLVCCLHIPTPRETCQTRVWPRCSAYTPKYMHIGNAAMRHMQIDTTFIFSGEQEVPDES